MSRNKKLSKIVRRRFDSIKKIRGMELIYANRLEGENKKAMLHVEAKVRGELYTNTELLKELRDDRGEMF